MIKKMLKKLVREAYWALECHDEDEFCSRFLIFYADRETTDDVVLAKLDDFASSQGRRVVSARRRGRRGDTT